NVVCVELGLDGDGRPSYRVQRAGRQVLAPSRLGMILADAPKLERNLAIADVRQATFDETWEQPWGERREVRNHYNELTVTLRGKSGPGRAFEAVFRLHDDALGCGYAFDRQRARERLEIVEELAEFHRAEDAAAWWSPAVEWNRAEYLFHATPRRQVGDAR